MRSKRLLSGCMVLAALSLFASENEILPSWHRANEMIGDLQVRGLFLDLSGMNRPYTRGDIAASILATGRKIKTNEIRLTGSELKRYKFLAQEFTEEIESLQGKDDSTDFIEAGGRLVQNLEWYSGEDTKTRGVYRGRIHVPAGEHVALFSSVSFDQVLANDPSYTGKKWRGAAGYAEEAYMNGRFGRFRLKIGRDFLRWGPGRTGTLLFSDTARPLDQFLGSADVGPFRYSYIISRLDDLLLSGLMADSLGGVSARRYVSGHRLDAHLLQGRLQVGVSEVAVFGGVNRIPDWIFLNPFIFYHGAQMNENLETNMLGSLDVLWHAANRLEIYGSLMIDDIQVEKTGPGDLEPNEIGVITGLRWAPGSGSMVSAEYVRVANRTYKTPVPWETFVLYNDPLGHPLGNDVDAWRIGFGQWIGASFRGELSYMHTRKGEGSLFTPFDMPWMEFTVKEGYSEPFPTGVVETDHHFQMQLCYCPSFHWGVNAELNVHGIQNEGHVKNHEESLTTWKLGLWADGDLRIHLK